MKKKLKQLAVDLTRRTHNGSCALWLSGGKDSRLLLEVLLKLNLKFSVINFNSNWSKEQNKVVDELIEKYNLLVYSYPPRYMTLIGDGKNEVSLAAGYAIGKTGETAAIISDFVDGDKCAFDFHIPLSEHIHPPVLFDTHIRGTKKSDSHYSGELIKQKSWCVGSAEVIAPLIDWTDREVLETLEHYGVNYEIPPEPLDTGNTVVCFECLKGKEKVFCPKEDKEIDSARWNPQGNSENWRAIA